MPTLAACCHRFSVGMPFVFPDNNRSFADNFLNMMFSPDESYPYDDPVIARALDVLFILHADHEQNCGTTAMRVVGSSHADPYTACAAAARGAVRPASRWRQRAGHPHAHRNRLDRERGRRSSKSVKAGTGGRLQGFGHRVYKNFDPRATIIKKTADEVFAVTGKNPLLDIALKLEEVALADEYFTSRKLYPNVDFYSGLIYQAMGFPIDMFTVLFAIPRTVGLVDALGGDARAGLEDRPPAPALHRIRAAGTYVRASRSARPHDHRGKPAGQPSGSISVPWECGRAPATGDSRRKARGSSPMRRAYAWIAST